MKHVNGPVDLGNEIETFVFIEEQGIKYPVAYYKFGVPQIDKILNNKLPYECGIAFHMISLEKGFCFVFGDIWKGDKFYVDRDKILEVKVVRPITMQQIVHSKFITFLKSGVFGQGLVGSLFSSGVGHTIERMTGLNTRDIQGMEYRLWYIDEDNQEKVVVINVPSTHEALGDTFFAEQWTSTIPKTRINPSSSSSNCFIATVCYGSIYSLQLETFRNYRDNYLKHNYLGLVFIKWYYSFGFLVSNYLRSRPRLTKIIRDFILNPILQRLKKRGY